MYARNVSLLFVFLFQIYSLVGSFGFLGIGNDVKSDILTSYHPVDAGVIVAMVFAVLKAITSFPIIFFCTRFVFMCRSSAEKSVAGQEKVLKVRSPIHHTLLGKTWT